MTDVIVHDLNGSGIYEIVNLKNGKRYVGSAKNFKVRWRIHRGDLQRGRHHSAYLQHSWNKYGSGFFAFRVLVTCPPEHLLECEQMLFDLMAPEFNVLKMAGSHLGAKRSQSTKDKLAAASLGKKRPPEVGLKIAEKARGRLRSEESKAKQSATAKGKPKPAGFGDNLKGNKHGVAKWQDPVWREEIIRKRREAWADPVLRAARLAKIRASKEARKATQKKEAMV